MRADEEKQMRKKFDVVAGLAGIIMWGVAAFALALAAAARFGLLARCSIGFDVLSILGMLSIGVMIVSIYFVKGTAAEAFNAGLERSVQAPIEIVRAIRRAHQRTFVDPRFHERGAIAANLKPLSQKTPRASGRQSGAKQSKKQSSGSKSDDSDGGDGEPPRKFLFAALCRNPLLDQQYHTYKNAAKKIDCSVQTLRNLVSAGKIPPPLKTAVGPRFSEQQLLDIISPPAKKTEQKQQKRPRGRPRIAMAKGGAA